MKAFITKPTTRAIIIASLTTLIGWITSLLGNWDKTQSYFIFKKIAFFISIGAYVFLTGFYAKNDVNQRRSNEVLQHQVDTFEDLVISIISICETTASDVNTCIHLVNERHIIDPNIWNYEKACKLVCERIYDNICRLSGSKKYGVAYIRLVEGGNIEDEVEMIAYANQNRHKPTIFKKRRKFKGVDLKNAYHDLCLFDRAKSDSDIRVGTDEVDEIFAYNSKEESNKNRGKYHLYVGIPVFCDNMKMVGLLEIVGLDKTTFKCITKDEVEEVSNKFLVPYANIFLLLHKMEKALLAGTQST